ncbi:lysM and putative peptidoglycan-binding domain-containing protein 1 [Engraulis encrasicolus]|uniref:lysM and putative peptidoglycan-binding domain-containing protein 1 n=1 Tax=Engraulis encrasicolus TaxID=184585 RepID=UPI002FD5C078
MSSERPVANGAPGLLRGLRTRSYGSIVNSSLSPVRQKRIEHEVQPGETLQGLSLKYGVSMEDIKRANRLYTNDSIFLKKSLSIPVLSALDAGLFSNGEEVSNEEICQEHCVVKEDPVKNGTVVRESTQECSPSDLSPMDYLNRIDSLISQSKQAAAKTCGEDKRYETEDPPHTIRRSRSQMSSSRSRPAPSHARQSQNLSGALPLTITKRTKKLQEREDEIFQL